MADAKQQISNTPSHHGRTANHLSRYLNDHLAGSTALITCCNIFSGPRRGKDMHCFW